MRDDQTYKTDRATNCHNGSGDKGGCDESYFLNSADIHSTAGCRMIPGADKVHIPADKHQNKYPQKNYRAHTENCFIVGDV